MLLSRWSKVLLGLCLAVAFLSLCPLLFGVPLGRPVSMNWISAEPQEGGLSMEGRLRLREPIPEWNRPLVSLRFRGKPVARVWEEQRLRQVGSAAFLVKGHSLFVWLPGENSAPAAQAGCVARVPLNPGLWLPLGAGLGAVLIGALLWWARDPFWVSYAVSRAAGWFVLLVLGLAMAMAVVIRVLGYSFPIFDADTGYYIQPVLDFLEGRHLTAVPRPPGYQLFLAAVLGVFRDFRAIVWVQQAGTLFAAFAVTAVLCRCGVRLFSSRAARLFVCILAALAFAAITLNEAVLQREWSILPEAWTAVYMGVQLWLCWHLATRARPGWRWLAEYGVFCIAGWLVYFTKSNWGFAVGLLPLPALYQALLRWTSGERFLRGLCAGLALLAVVSVAAFSVHARLMPEDTLLSLEIRARVLVCWHINLVRPEIDRRLAANPPEKERNLLQEFAHLIDAERENTRLHGPGEYPLLGHDADRLFYEGFDTAVYYPKLPIAERVRFCTTLFWGGLRQQPDLYFRKVMTQAANFYRKPYGLALVYLPVTRILWSRSEEVATHPPYYLPESFRAKYAPVVAHAGPALAGAWPSPARQALSLRINAIFVLLGKLFPWALAVSLLTTLTAALWPRWRRAIPWRDFAPVLLVAIWALGSAALCALSSATVQALEIQRYLDLYLPLSVFAEILWPCIAVALFLRSKSTWRAPVSRLR